MRKRTLKILFFLVCAFAVFSVLFVEYSATPQFCNSCHNMEPYYNAWKASSHNFVPCVDCHYTPGLESQARSKFEAINQVVSYVTRTYGSRPRAEISDMSCLRSGCHSQRLLQGRVDFNGIYFDHRPHLVEVRRGLKLRCTSCHSQIVQGTHMTVTTSTCFLCHFKGTESGKSIAGCTSCHPPPESVIEFEGIAFSHAEVVERGLECSNCHVQVIQGSGDVPRERCLICHGEPQRIERYDEVQFIHGKHVSEHKVDCEECHNSIEHGLVKMASSIEVECSSCHPDHHSEVRELYMGVGGKGLPANPSSMFLTRVGCNGCHLVHKKVEGYGEIMVASEASCIHCHGTKFHGMLGNWKRVITESVESLLKTLDEVEAIVLASAGDEGYGSALRSLETARHNIEVVHKGDGVHNVEYSIELLEESYQSIRKSLVDVGSDYQPSRPGLTPASDSARRSCSTCHVGMEENEEEIFGYHFDHSPHLGSGIDCLVCHEGLPGHSEVGHGALRLAAGDCMDCHHSGESGDCARCHEDYKTKMIRMNDEIFVHDRHLENAGLECVECHEKSDVNRADLREGLECYGCHHDRQDLECESCHTAQARFMSGAGVGGVTDEPSIMADAVECGDCHREIQKGYFPDKLKNACTGCHDEEYAGILADWQGTTERGLEKIEGLYKKLEKNKLELNPEELKRRDEGLALIREKIEWIRRDGSLGAHNPFLTETLIDECARETEMILQNDPGK